MFKNTLRNFLQEDFPISFIWNPFLHDFMSFLTSMGLVPELFLETFFKNYTFLKIMRIFMKIVHIFIFFTSMGLVPELFGETFFKKNILF